MPCCRSTPIELLQTAPRCEIRPFAGLPGRLLWPLLTSQRASVTVAGNLRIESAEEGSAINEAKTYTYSGSWQGAPTETALSPAGHLNSARKALLVYADGKTTLGSFYMLNRSINGDVLADLRVSFDGKFTGAVTKTDAS